MFTIIGQCVARKNYVNISKVKVTLWVQRSKMAINELVRAITMSFIKGFWNHLAHMFTIIGQCVARKNYVNISKVKVTLWGQRSKMAIDELVRAIAMLFIVRLWNQLAHLFAIMRRCVARKELRLYLQGQGHTLRSKMAINELVRAITMWYHQGILKLFGTFVHHHWTVCCAKELRQYLQGQGHTLMSKFKNVHEWACPGHSYVVHCDGF